MNISSQGHVPVLLSEVITYLNPKPGEIFIDATLGGGGHTRALLLKEPNCKVIGLDWDKKVLDEAGVRLQEEFPGRFFPIFGNFAKIDALIERAGYSKVDGILADFGTSQMQIKSTPGFSVYQDSALDMRFAPSMFHITAYDIVNRFSEKDLADIFFEYAQETRSRKIAREIVEQRKRKPIKTTLELAQLISDITPGSYHKIHPATKVFQALRIYVNKELDNIRAFLQNSTHVLKDGGRLVCISFHSLEDRLVKQFFRDRSSKTLSSEYFEMLTKGACSASFEELQSNRSARSARLRAGILRI